MRRRRLGGRDQADRIGGAFGGTALPGWNLGDPGLGHGAGEIRDHAHLAFEFAERFELALQVADLAGQPGQLFLLLDGLGAKRLDVDRVDP